LNGIVFKTKLVNLKTANKRIILSRRKREEIVEIIDERFRSLQKDRPELKYCEIYSIISDESDSLFGIHLGARQVEGKHRTFLLFLENRRKR
jgi:hypothetical protein